MSRQLNTVSHLAKQDEYCTVQI